MSHAMSHTESESDERMHGDEQPTHAQRIAAQIRRINTILEYERDDVQRARLYAKRLELSQQLAPK